MQFLLPDVLGYCRFVEPYRAHVGEEGKDYSKYNWWYYEEENTSAWCAVFVSWCAEGAELGSLFPKVAYAPTMQTYYKNKQTYHTRSDVVNEDYTPEPGDLIFFDSTTDPNGIADHVGMVVSYDLTSQTVYTIEGNAGDPGRVRKKDYNLTKSSWPMGFGSNKQDGNDTLR